jgi:hypothetical protein
MISRASKHKQHTGMLHYRTEGALYIVEKKVIKKMDVKVPSYPPIHYNSAASCVDSVLLFFYAVLLKVLNFYHNFFLLPRWS